MARLLIDGAWYEAVASTAYYEAEYERLILQNAASLYPGYRMVSFKKLVQSPYGAAKPDFALLARDYSGWFVVEVELAHHSLLGHVLPQVEVLATARYGDGEADYLAAMDAGLERSKLREVMRGAPPRVLVIANGSPDEWAPVLSRFDAVLVNVEVFRSSRNHHVFRVSGASPTTALAVVSACRVDRLLPRLLKLDSPATVGFDDRNRVRIEWEGAEMTWARVVSKDSVWLSPDGSNPLPLREELVILRDGDRLVFRRARHAPSITELGADVR